MPSAVLLAILVGVGVLVLIPALIRRYDISAKADVERWAPSMRVLDRGARRRFGNSTRRRRVVADSHGEPVADETPSHFEPDPIAETSVVAEPVPAMRKRPKPESSRGGAVARRRRRVVLLGLLFSGGFGGAGFLVTPMWHAVAGAALMLTSGYLVGVRAAVRRSRRVPVSLDGRRPAYAGMSRDERPAVDESATSPTLERFVATRPPMPAASPGPAAPITPQEADDPDPYDLGRVANF